MTRERSAASADRASSPRLEPISSLDAVRREWTQLAEASANVFSTWEWASTWWRAVGGNRPLLLFACRADHGRLAALLPLYLWSARPLRIARFLGHGPADQLGPVCPPAERPLAAAGLLDACSDAGLGLLFAELLPAGEGWRPALGARLLHSEASPTLSLARDWETYLAARSANFRQQIRRRERRLVRNHMLRYRLAVDPARLDEDLTLLFALHARRWGPRSAFERWEPFHREFARVALARGWLRLWFLELDGRPVAAWYGFRFAGVESYYQAGRDPGRGDESVGFVLLAHSIREAVTDGMREYRFLRGGEAFKYRFADADPGLETVALSRGVAGKLAGIAAAAGLRSPGVGAALRRLAGR